MDSRQKLENAIQLSTPPDLWDEYLGYKERLARGKKEDNPLSNDIISEYMKNLDMSIIMYEEICNDTTIGDDERANAMISFVENIPNEGLETLVRFRDMIAFLKGNEYASCINILVKLSESTRINSHERMMIAVTLYNNFRFDICYECFANMVSDKSIIIKYRIEAARYLFGSDSSKYTEISQEALIEIVDSPAYPSEFRYNVIAGFISKTGIGTMLNSSKLKIQYDEEFVCSLQLTFFYNEKNGIRERIMSGQHLLDMKVVDNEEKIDISKNLLDISKNTELSDNTRADAADVVLRLGVDEQKISARDIITSLGWDPSKNNFGTFLEKSKTVYNNSQNVHDTKINECVEKFIEKIVSDTTIKIKSYTDVHREVTEMIRKKGSDQSIKFRAYRALNRVSIDTAVFTNKRVSISEIFVHVWVRIQQYDKEKRDILEERMIEELSDMSDTCSSGHSSRFVNILSTYDSSLTISWESQIKANIAGRMNAKIRDIDDEDLKNSVTMGMMDDAEESDKKIYTEFINSSVSGLKIDLEKEFVEEGYIKSTEFNDYFDKSVVDLFPGLI